MREIGLRMEGGDALAANLKTLSSRVSKSLMREALMEGAEPIRDRGEVLAPRAPGAPDIAEHIVIGPARAQDAVAVAVGPSTERRSDQPRTTFARQGVMLEFGTARMGAQPFMRPAFDEMHRPALTVIGAALWRELVGRGLGRSMGIGSGPTSGGPGGSGLR